MIAYLPYEQETPISSDWKRPDSRWSGTNEKQLKNFPRNRYFYLTESD
jgi:hypothetical protein